MQGDGPGPRAWGGGGEPPDTRPGVWCPPSGGDVTFKSPPSVGGGGAARRCERTGRPPSLSKAAAAPPPRALGSFRRTISKSWPARQLLRPLQPYSKGPRRGGKEGGATASVVKRAARGPKRPPGALSAAAPRDQNAPRPMKRPLPRRRRRAPNGVGKGTRGARGAASGAAPARRPPPARRAERAGAQMPVHPTDQEATSIAVAVAAQSARSTQARVRENGGLRQGPSSMPSLSDVRWRPAQPSG